MIREGKNIRVQVKTARAVYTGDFFIPSARKRFSDVVNEPGKDFINLTNVHVEGTGGSMEHLSLGKYLIESIRSLEANDRG